MKLITFTEEDTASPAEETVTAATVPAEETVAATIAPEATIAIEDITVTKDEDAVSAEEDFVLTIGAVDGETVVLYAEAETQTSASIAFQPKNFVDNLQYMGIGMLTIFIVIGVIILATTLINKIFSKK